MIQVLLFLLPFFSSTDPTLYRSEALHDVQLTPSGRTHAIRDDEGSQIEITALKDRDGILYWYRRIKTPVCLTGECKLVDVGLYWDCTGDFFGLDVYGEHLTKTDHSIFTDADYDRLLGILANDWSILREYDFAELTSAKPETEGVGVDATSGATRKEIAAEAVQDAVYTTYTLWHLVHMGEKEQLMNLTADELNRDPLMNDMVASGNKKYTRFLLELFNQSKIDHLDKLTPLILQGLRSAGDPHTQNLALRALGRLDVNEKGLQAEIAKIYSTAPEDMRLRLIAGLKEIRHVTAPMYAVLEQDLYIQNEWFAIKVLNVLARGEAHSPRVIDAARRLAESKNSAISESARDILEVIVK